VPVLEKLTVPQGSVAIIPNQKTVAYGDSEHLMRLYHQIVENLHQQKKYVFLIYHSAEDLPICRDIKIKYFPDNDFVQVVERELSCLEFDETVKQFDFVVASRFHAIVHAYRNGVPAVVLGWAVKYQELLAMFSQEAFQFDVRGQLETADIIAAVQDMCEKHESISRNLQQKLHKIQAENVYDYLNNI
jgi:colanic acid/amylovoran biosynthesis protein